MPRTRTASAVRPFITALIATLAIAVAVAAAVGFSEPAVDAATAPRHRTHQTITVPDQPSYSLEGLNETIGGAAVWSAGVARQEEAARQAAAEKVRQAARGSARHVTTSPPRATTAPSTSTARPSFDDAAFDRVANCETGGQWDHQTAFDGGLGILHANWRDLRTGNGYAQAWPELPEYGSQASRELQIAAARRFITRYGIGGWGCKKYFYG